MYISVYLFGLFVCVVGGGGGRAPGDFSLIHPLTWSSLRIHDTHTGRRTFGHEAVAAGIRTPNPPYE